MRAHRGRMLSESVSVLLSQSNIIFNSVKKSTPMVGYLFSKIHALIVAVVDSLWL